MFGRITGDGIYKKTVIVFYVALDWLIRIANAEWQPDTP